MWPSTNIDTTFMDESSDDASQARAAIKQMADNVNAMKDAKGQAEGIAELDLGGKVPAAQLPTITAQKGGTGQDAYTVGDVLYANSTTSLAKLAAGTLGYVLTSNGPGNAPSWQQAGGGLVTGTRLAFNQTVAPVGWTKDTTINDAILRIVSGTVSQGGSQAFSDFNAINSTGAHTLTTGQIPAHTHIVSGYTENSKARVKAIHGGDTNGGSPAASIATSSVGSGGAHSHTLTHNIKYVDFIIAVKD